jgi:hypothetical protein
MSMKRPANAYGELGISHNLQLMVPPFDYHLLNKKNVLSSTAFIAGRRRYSHVQKVTSDPGSTGQPTLGKYYKMFTTYSKNVLSTKIEQILQDVDHV